MPRTTILGDFLAYINERWDEEGLTVRFSPLSGNYLRRAEEIGLYTKDRDIIRARIEECGLAGVLSRDINS